MKTVDDILEEIAQLRANMSHFLQENRDANERLGYPLVGPAAKSIGIALEELTSAYKQIVEK